MTIPSVYADQLVVGTVYDLGSHHVTRNDIINFAREWDPQVFHLDGSEQFGDVIASGIHSMVILDRMSISVVVTDWHSIAGRRFGDCLFSAPLTPDTRVTGTLTIDTIDAPRRGRSAVHTTGVLTAGHQQLLSVRSETLIRIDPRGSWSRGLLSPP